VHDEIQGPGKVGLDLWVLEGKAAEFLEAEDPDPLVGIEGKIGLLPGALAGGSSAVFHAEDAPLYGKGTLDLDFRTFEAVKDFRNTGKAGEVYAQALEGPGQGLFRRIDHPGAGSGIPYKQGFQDILYLRGLKGKGEERGTGNASLVFKEAQAGRKEGELSQGEARLRNQGYSFGRCRNRGAGLGGPTGLLEIFCYLIMDSLGTKAAAVQEQPQKHPQTQGISQ
jgi:hypothetical protein